MDTSSTIFTKSSQLLGFADDLDIMGRNMDDVMEKFKALDTKGADLGLKVNDAKTEFVYLGSQLNSDNDIMDEIKRWITLGNRNYYSMMKILESKSVSRNSICALYKSVIRPIVMYGSESWTIAAQVRKKGTADNFGPLSDENQNRWRRRFNFELMQLYKKPDVIKITKINRLRWLGHVQRMDDNRIRKKILETRPEGKRSAGRPKSSFTTTTDRIPNRRMMCDV